MRYEQIKEGVEYGDLQSLVKNIVSIAEFEPKTGTDNDVVVIGFYVDDEAPAQDLGTFLERGVAEILDTEVSPNPDDEGYYMVFVEIDNDEKLMENVFEMILDTERLTNIQEWTLRFFNGTTKTITTEQIKAWLKTNT